MAPSYLLTPLIVPNHSALEIGARVGIGVGIGVGVGAGAGADLQAIGVMSKSEIAMIMTKTLDAFSTKPPISH